MSSNTPYGSIVYDPDGKVCHSYAGDTVLYPATQNGSATYWQYLYGLSYCGAEAACPADSALSPSPSAASSITAGLHSRGLRALQVDQVTRFAVFRGKRKATDTMPASAMPLVANASTSGISKLARAVDSPTGRGWVTPADDAICLSVPDPVDGFGSTCADTDRAIDAGIALMMVDPASPDAVNVTLLIPDGGSATLVNDTSGSSALEPDSNGIVAAQLTRSQHVIIETATGQRTIEMPAAPVVN